MRFCCSFFHSCYVDNLLDDRTAKNLLYVEMVEQIKRGMIQVSADALRDLESVRKSSQKQEVCTYMRTCISSH